MATFALPDNDVCVVPLEAGTMVPVLPGVATEVPGTTTALAGADEVQHGTSDKALGIRVLLIVVVLVSSGGERLCVTSSATSAIN